MHVVLHPVISRRSRRKEIGQRPSTGTYPRIKMIIKEILEEQHQWGALLFAVT
jgi:hypothetical protein